MKRSNASGPVLYVVILSLLACSATAQAVGTEQAAIERVINASIGWALNKDLGLLFSCFAQDTSLFIFHPDSVTTVRGFEEFKKLTKFWMDPRFKATDFAVKDLRINFSRSGDVAWYSCYLLLADRIS